MRLISVHGKQAINIIKINSKLSLKINAQPTTVQHEFKMWQIQHKEEHNNIITKINKRKHRSKANRVEAHGKASPKPAYSKTFSLISNEREEIKR